MAEKHTHRYLLCRYGLKVESLKRYKTIRKILEVNRAADLKNTRRLQVVTSGAAATPARLQNLLRPLSFGRKQLCRSIRTCRSLWADAGERVGPIDTASQSAGVRFAVIDVHLTPVTSEPVETSTQVLPAARREVHVGHTGGSVQTLTGDDRHLTGQMMHFMFSPR